MYPRPVAGVVLHLDVVSIVLGSVLLVAGAVGVVEGGSAIARRMGISPLWVGLTVVAFGTSTPELVVSVVAAAGGSPGVAVGNVVGSNVLNVFVVLGVTALVAPVAVQRVTLRRDIRILLAISLAVWALAADGLLHRAEGLLLVAGVVPFVVHLYREEKRGWAPVLEPARGLERFPLPVQLGALALGVALLVFGGRFMVDGGVGIAAHAGVSERVVGLTVVAVGTSLPELATSIAAAMRRNVDMAVGNVVGSNVLNLLMVLGASAVAAPIPVPLATVRVDLAVMVLAVVVLAGFASSRNRISRTEGALLLAGYAVFLGLTLGGVLG